MAALLAFLNLLKAVAVPALLVYLAARARADGQVQEAAKVDQVSAAKEAAIAQAEVAAPTTREAVVDALRKGTF